MTPTPPETVLQFGAGKFLRCFADLFAHEANQGPAPAGRVVVVQSTGNQRARQINAQGGRYRVAIRGLMAGECVDRVVEVASIGRAPAAAEQWPEVLDFARAESLRTIVSNTTEAGYALDDTDRPEDAPPRSFPAKLLRALQERQRAGLPGVTVLPCELYDGNAARLLALVLEQAQRWRVESDTVEWLQDACRWCNTLVDRIVSAPTPGDPLAAADPLFAVAEPFALWLIEGQPQAPWLAQHPAKSADATERSRIASKVSYRLRILRAHGLIRKSPGRRRYHMTTKGRHIVTALLQAQHATLQQLNALAA